MPCINVGDRDTQLVNMVLKNEKGKSIVGGIRDTVSTVDVFVWVHIIPVS
jgi:hypothetical protein